MEISYWGPATQVLPALGRMLERLTDGEAHGLRADRAEIRRALDRIEVFERQYAAFIADTEEVVRRRDSAQAIVLKFAELRKKLEGIGERLV